MKSSLQVVIAGVLANKQIELGPLAVEAGILAFLMLVVTSSTVAELFCRPTANRLVMFGFIPMIFSRALATLVLALPAADEMDPQRLAAFETVMGATPRIWLAGIIAYGVSQFLNVSIFTRLKRGTGQFLWLRAGIAGMLSQVVDTFLFIGIAFYGVFPIFGLMVGQMLAKVVLSAIMVPPFIYLFVAIARRLDGERPTRA